MSCVTCQFFFYKVAELVVEGLLSTGPTQSSFRMSYLFFVFAGMF